MYLRLMAEICNVWSVKGVTLLITIEILFPESYTTLPFGYITGLKSCNI